AKALEVLNGYSWPGNVRELKNTLYRAYIMADDVVEIQPPGQSRSHARSAWQDGQLQIQIGMSLADAQREIILAMLEHFSGDKRETAKALGISLKTLYNRLESYQSGQP